MFDFDASKLLIIGVVALIVIGPKDLPRVLRQVGQMVTKLRRMAGEFQGQFMEAMKEADLQDLKNEVTKLKETASLDVAFNPVADIKSELTRAVGSATSALESPAAPPAAESSLAGPVEPPSVAMPPPAPALSGAASGPDPVVLEAAEPAHHTAAVSAGAVHAVEPDAAGDPGRRRRILVPKRRPPGDRLVGPSQAVAARGRSFLPPRRDPRP
jgi:sec-independent protein translocase protein TatB